MAKVLDLRGMIYAKFDNETKAADALGWSRQRLNKITSGKKIPDLDEVNDLARVLDTSFMDVARIFLPSQSTNDDG
jgi:transcriptional regulator with XRE-family HTH domain